MGIERCGVKAMNVVRVTGLGRFLMCTRHLADKHLQYLITIGVAESSRVEGLGGGCDMEIYKVGKVELVGGKDAQEDEGQGDGGGDDEGPEGAA